VCAPCGDRIDHNTRQLRSRGLVLSGVCLRLHGSDEEKESLRQKGNVAEALGSKRRASRSSRSAESQQKNIYLAAPSNDSRLYLEMNKELPRARASRKLASTLAAIRNADMKNKTVGRAVLGLMVGKKNVVKLSHGGTSKSSMNKANATTGIAANALTGMLTMQDPLSFETVQQKLSAHAAKQAPPFTRTQKRKNNDKKRKRSADDDDDEQGLSLVVGTET
jgi:hypothetical protein